MSVRDHGLDVIRKAAEGYPTPSDKDEFLLRTKVVNPVDEPAQVCVSPGNGNIYKALTVTSSEWTEIVPSVGRKHISIQNNQSSDVRIRHDDPGDGVAADVGTGMLIESGGGERSYDIQQQPLWVRLESGPDRILDTEEIS